MILFKNSDKLNRSEAEGSMPVMPNISEGGYS